MVSALSPEQEIAELRQALAERDAVIAAHQAEAAIVQTRLTTALLEIEHIKAQLASLRRQRYGQSSEKLDADIAQLEMRLEDFKETFDEPGDLLRGLYGHWDAVTDPTVDEKNTPPSTKKPEPQPAVLVYPWPAAHRQAGRLRTAVAATLDITMKLMGAQPWTRPQMR